MERGEGGERRGGEEKLVDGCCENVKINLYRSKFTYDNNYY